MTIPSARLTASQSYRQSSERVAIAIAGIGALDTRLVGAIETGGATVDVVAAESVIRVQCSVANGDIARLATHRRLRAEYGRARRTRVVGHVSAEVADQVKRWGCFDANDGLFFELDGETLSVVRRTNVTGSPVETRIGNQQWDVSDPIDTTRTHVYEIRECWPNGNVGWFVDDDLVHTMSTAAAITGPATVPARLPLAVEAENEAATSAGSFKLIEGTVFVEELPRHSATRSLVIGDASVDGTGQALCSIRLKSAAAGGELQPTRIDVATNGDAHLLVYAGSTVSDGSWAAHDAESLAESNATTVALPADGVVAAAAVVNGACSIDLNDLPPAVLLADDTQDTLTVVVKSLTGSSITARVALSWRETR